MNPIDAGRGVAHPDWLEAAFKRYSSTYALYVKRRLPRQIEVSMMVAPIQWNLRAILGKSNIGCAIWLLRKEIASKLFPILHPIVWIQTLRDASEYDRETKERP